ILRDLEDDGGPERGPIDVDLDVAKEALLEDRADVARDLRRVERLSGEGLDPGTDLGLLDPPIAANRDLGDRLARGRLHALAEQTLGAHDLEHDDDTVRRLLGPREHPRHARIRRDRAPISLEPARVEGLAAADAEATAQLVLDLRRALQ